MARKPTNGTGGNTRRSSSVFCRPVTRSVRYSTAASMPTSSSRSISPAPTRAPSDGISISDATVSVAACDASLGLGARRLEIERVRAPGASFAADCAALPASSGAPRAAGARPAAASAAHRRTAARLHRSTAVGRRDVGGAASMRSIDIGIAALVELRRRPIDDRRPSSSIRRRLGGSASTARWRSSAAMAGRRRGSGSPNRRSRSSAVGAQRVALPRDRRQLEISWRFASCDRRRAASAPVRTMNGASEKSY